MASKTDICNRGLSKLGIPRVSNVETADTKAARVMRYNYDTLRDALLTEYPWNFALKRGRIAANATAPSWGFNKAYTLPSDFLALIEIKNNPDYRVETDADGDIAILTNEGSPLYILYISRVTDTGRFDPLFIEAFASRLALEGSEELTESNTKKQILFQEYQQSITRAYASDAIQDPAQNRRESEWVLSRWGASDDIDYNTEL